MAKINSSWLYALIGYCTNYREFISSFKNILNEMETEFYMDGFHLVDVPNVWKYVAENCYGNYEKDIAVLSKINVVYVSFDEINNLIAISVYNAFDKYKPYNEEYMAKEILSKAAKLIDSPESWIFKLENLGKTTPSNFFVKPLVEPIDKSQFDVNDSMYYTRIDDFGKEISSIKGYTGMYDVISDSGTALSKAFKIDTTDPEKFMKELMSYIGENAEHLEEGLDKLNAIQEPYTFFELEHKPISESFNLVRELSLYAAKLIHYNCNNIYKNAEITYVTTPPAPEYTTQNFFYSKEPLDFIVMSCEIEKEVLGNDIENDLREVIVIDSNEDFFND